MRSGILSHATTSYYLSVPQFPQRFALKRGGVVVSQHVFTQMKVDDPKPFGVVTGQQAEPTNQAST